ncbi:bifunctional transcriptional activator/DNA repair enzyme AdaA [Alteribacillus sp. HJP-4]|uniref:bifunctional transcriptional activator/DNA repair enzyme AdaA n=1 Tax=Alteribacillus sp. HJP-4 TaxID=2775394 RepID=UPI0035CD1D48
MFKNLTFSEMMKITASSDSSYDGMFFYAVKTTGIFCRPSCSSRRPNKENVTFFETTLEARAAGYRPCKRCEPETTDFAPDLDIIKNVRSFIHEHYKEKLTLPQMAHHAGVSPYYLGRLFKKRTLETPRVYLERVRLRKAIQLLKTTDLSILDVCLEAGFQNQSSFYQAFQRKNTVSPKRYRKEKSLEL